MQQAKSEFEKDFYKLMNNAPFGKSFENVGSRSTIEIVNGQETRQLEKFIAKPNFRDAHIFEHTKNGTFYGNLK